MEEGKDSHCPETVMNNWWNRKRVFGSHVNNNKKKKIRKVEQEVYDCDKEIGVEHWTVQVIFKDSCVVLEVNIEVEIGQMVRKHENSQRQWCTHGSGWLMGTTWKGMLECEWSSHMTTARWHTQRGINRKKLDGKKAHASKKLMTWWWRWGWKKISLVSTVRSLLNLSILSYEYGWFLC